MSQPIDYYFDSTTVLDLVAAKVKAALDEETPETVKELQAFIEDTLIDNDWGNSVSDTSELETEADIDGFFEDALEAGVQYVRARLA